VPAGSAPPGIAVSPLKRVLGVSPNRPERSARVLGLVLCIATLYLAVALWLLPDYGTTWDTTVGELPFGDRLVEYFQTGDERFLDLMEREPPPRVREPHPDYDMRRTEWYVVHPFAAILSGISCRLLWTELGWLDAQSAHHLPALVFSILLAVGLGAFAAKRFGWLPGLASAAFLLFCPRFFAHSFNNLKDVPECALYTGAMLAGFLALSGEKRRWWVIAGVLTGLALAQKANALFIPIQLGVFYAASRWLTRREAEPSVRFQLAGAGWFALAFLLAYYAVSPNYWSGPIEGPSLRIGHMLRAGNALFSPAGEPGVAMRGVSLEALKMVFLTTPPLVLGLGLFGLVHKGLGRRERAFLVVGLAIPIGRNLIPGMANYDGVRHFLEFLPILALSAGLGLAALVRRVSSRFPGISEPVLASVFLIAALTPSLVQVIRTHPFGIAYYNALAGGLSGAQRSGLRESTDYWGSSYRQGIAWLNENATPNSRVVVPIAEHVAWSARKTLRNGLRFWNPETDREGETSTTYIMYVTRRTFYGAFLRELEARMTPTHELVVQGGVILRIFRVEPGEQANALWNISRKEEQRRKSRNRLWAWLKQDRERLLGLNEVLRRVQGQGFEIGLAELQAFFPEELSEDIRPAAEFLMRGELTEEKP